MDGDFPRYDGIYHDSDYRLVWLSWGGHYTSIVAIRESKTCKNSQEHLCLLPRYSFSNRVSSWKAINIEHHVDRMNAFITLVFGHIILSVLYESSAHFGLNAYITHFHTISNSASLGRQC